ncbi:hypothetical protein A3L11_09720 [Thermococcus siculi]|uniref:Uncharacterized protein n=1 Tax=Thermococcus siculi TaxID=72803 RepID=A0A2Z2MZG5_9EURY|nr:hypothetical protein A3L11_09720 [Thermococcus siculi]
MSLLPLAGMFIFGGKKEKKREESKVPESLREKYLLWCKDTERAFITSSAAQHPTKMLEK